MERRHSTRIPFRAAANVVRNGASSPCEVRDISKNGLFVSTRDHYEKGDRTLVSIYLQDGKTTLSVTLPCAVARISDSGVGCTSPYLEPETLLFISNLINAKKVTPSEFMQTFYSYMNGLELHPCN